MNLRKALDLAKKCADEIAELKKENKKYYEFANSVTCLVVEGSELMSSNDLVKNIRNEISKLEGKKMSETGYTRHECPICDRPSSYGLCVECEKKELITVCDKCLTASCWQGAFMCDESYEAGTIQKTKKELIELGLENEDWLKTDEELMDM